MAGIGIEGHIQEVAASFLPYLLPIRWEGGEAGQLSRAEVECNMNSALPVFCEGENDDASFLVITDANSSDDTIYQRPTADSLLLLVAGSLGPNYTKTQ